MVADTSAGHDKDELRPERPFRQVVAGRQSDHGGDRAGAGRQRDRHREKCFLSHGLHSIGRRRLSIASLLFLVQHRPAGGRYHEAARDSQGRQRDAEKAQDRRSREEGDRQHDERVEGDAPGDDGPLRFGEVHRAIEKYERQTVRIDDREQRAELEEELAQHPPRPSAHWRRGVVAAASRDHPDDDGSPCRQEDVPDRHGWRVAQHGDGAARRS